MLATFPKLTADSLFGEDGDFCEKTEEYINDRFVMRDTFTAINASVDYLFEQARYRRDMGLQRRLLYDKMHARRS